MRRLTSRDIWDCTIGRRYVVPGIMKNDFGKFHARKSNHGRNFFKTARPLS